MGILEISEEKITKEYIAKKHFEGWKKFFKEKSKSSQISFPYVVGFRYTGEHSVRMLNAGAGAKPHTVLEKTIKAGTITSKEKNEKLLALLYGLVAKRDAAGEIEGIYYADPTQGVFKRGKNVQLRDFIQAVTRISSGEMKRLDSMTPEKIFEEMDKPGSLNYASEYLSGDYDLHDLISKISQTAPIPSDSNDEARALNTLNQIMMGLERQTQWTFVHNPYYPVQHGPQYNYIAHMYAEEPTKKLAESVAKAAFPVLMLNVRDGREDWKEITDLEGLKAYYESLGITVKNSWTDPLYIAKRQDKSFEQFMSEQHTESFGDYLRR